MLIPIYARGGSVLPMSRRSQRFDPLSVVERGYDLDCALTDWLDGVVSAVRRGFPEGSFVGASTVLYRELGERRIELSVRDPREPAAYESWVREVVREMPESVMSTVFGPAPFIGEARSERAFEDLVEPLHAGVDSIGFSVSDGAGRGLLVGSLVPAGVRMTQLERRRWFRVVAHLGAAMRLRHRFATHAPTPDAVFRPDGKLLHASPEVASGGLRAMLTDAVDRLARAKQLRSTSPEEALALFRALADGQYSVVDWVDSDGKRFVVVHENDMPAGSLRALSRREAQVGERMLEGRSNAEIGYLLGLSPGTVNRIARDVLAKLGGAKRADLPRLFEHGLSVGEIGDGGLRTLALGPRSGSSAHWEKLSRAEREVVRLALAGNSNGSIAETRRVSVRTVANQLGLVYARYGVRGRVELGGLLGVEPPCRDGEGERAEA